MALMGSSSSKSANQPGVVIPASSSRPRGPPAGGDGGPAPNHARADEIALCLDSAGPDAQSADIPIGPLQRILAAVAVPTVNLDGLVADVLGRQVGGSLGHGRLHRRWRAPRSGQAYGSSQQQARTLESHRHVGQLPLQTLQLGDRPPTDDAIVHIVDRAFESTLGGPHAHGGVAAALMIEM